jgi:hypothetical protein
MDGDLEGQPLGPQQACRHAVTLAHDRRQDDGPVDVRAPALLGCRSGILEDALDVAVDARGGGILRMGTILDAADVSRNIVAQPGQIDAAAGQHGDRILVLGQRQQHVFEAYQTVPLLARIRRRTAQRIGQGPRCRHHARLLRHRLRHPKLPAGRIIVVFGPLPSRSRAQLSWQCSPLPGSIMPARI